MAAAIAMQETYPDCWGRLYQTKPVDVVLRLCVGDTLDFPRRGAGAFPRDKADLCQTPAGQQMFDVARQALLDIAQFDRAYAAAAQNPDKFCHGFGIFQYDIQHFKTDSDTAFFLQRGWCDFAQCVAKLVKELNAALATVYGAHKTTLNDDEMMYVAIAYNCGHARVGGGPKQGFQDGDGKFYGENFQRYLALAHSIQAEAIAGGQQIPIVPPVITPAGQPDLATLVQQVLALMQTLPAQRAQPLALPTQPADQVQQFIKLLTALAGGLAGPAGGLGPVNGALGQTIGNLLNGKKSAIGIIGAMLTGVLQAVGPSLPTVLPLVGSFAGLGGAAMPIFLGLAVWGALGKLEKCGAARQRDPAWKNLAT